MVIRAPELNTKDKKKCNNKLPGRDSSSGSPFGWGWGPGKEGIGLPQQYPCDGEKN